MRALRQRAVARSRSCILREISSQTRFARFSHAFGVHGYRTPFNMENLHEAPPLPRLLLFPCWGCSHCLLPPTVTPARDWLEKRRSRSAKLARSHFLYWATIVASESRRVRLRNRCPLCANNGHFINEGCGLKTPACPGT